MSTASGSLELARDGGQVADELVRLLADDAAALEVGQDAIEEVGIAQERQRLVLLRWGDGNLIGIALGALGSLRGAVGLELDDERIEILVDEGFL